MPARDTKTDQAEVILNALAYLKEAEKVKPNGIHTLYTRWCDDHNSTVDASRETIRKWCKGEARPTKPGSFYAYAQTVGEPVSGSTVDDLTLAIRSLFPSGDVNETKKLIRLHGHFEIIRRLWTPVGNDQCVRCVVNFNYADGKCIFTGDERFTSRHFIDESYTGYTFLFGTSFWIIAHEQRRHSVKFLTIHECVPPLTADVNIINKCVGNLIAVSGKGPNFGHPFVMRRLNNKENGCRVMTRHQASVFLDRTDYQYLYREDEK